MSKDVLKKLEIALEKKMVELEEDFFNDENLPSITTEDTHIVNPFYSECMRFKVNPIEYYNMNDEELDMFFKYYGINKEKDGR